ncbi:carboxypeptidase-like regulatory domain-containing protein [Chitinophaga rhizophila]|uniref:Carboxypeptidase-like regulatory domain-containing protein n=1 Tax=Chitinophaga rhizophila TaxID=2866212 RepID=A0ABS7GK04_9BACT|nr:carboxypeptidase-like regulatory domain-containing protein [Chitinophaga rhizophila]MBW8688062.1 carboxypeptidase-like regulatory domain-containing protein [Chitinophaga rhizophila]
MMSLFGRFLLGMLLISITVQASEWDWRTRVSVVVTDQPLETVCVILEKQYGIHFSYSRNIVDLTPSVNVNVQNKPLKKALEEIFSPFNIHFARIGDQIVLTVRNTPTYTVSGYVQDARSGEKLIGATVYSPTLQIGTTTNQFGFFSITLPHDSAGLFFSYIGYETGRLPVRKSEKAPVIIPLQPRSSLPEIVVVDSSRQHAEHLNFNRLNVSAAAIKSMPRLLGEADVMRTIVALPGVSGGLEGAGALYVRGGSPDQNLILLDGTPIFNVSHLFGIFSVFNPDIVKNADFYKGAFPARYGGRLSSIVDISLKDGDMQQYHGEAAIGLIAAKAMVEGPIKKGQTSFLVSARRSHAGTLNDIILNTSAENTDSKAYVYFYDANLKVNHIFSPRDRLYLSAYVGQDKLSVRWEEKQENTGSNTGYYGDSRSNFLWGNYTSTLRWNHVFGPKMFANVTGNYSQYYFSTDYKYNYKPVNSPDTAVLSGKYYSRIQNAVGKIDFEYRPQPKHTIKFGTGAITHIFTPGVSVFQDNGKGQPAVDTTYGDVSTIGQELLLYGEDEWHALHNLWLNLGIHASSFLVDGRFYSSIQPRLGARYQLPRRWVLKGSYTHMNQYLHLLSNNGANLPTDLWVPSSGSVKPMFSRQGSFGISKTSRYGMYALSLETYYKTMDHVIEYKGEAASFTGAGRDWDEIVDVGKGRSYGGELMLEKKKGTTRGWIGYTLAWSDRTFPSVNNGKTFPYNYDRRHDLEIVITQKLGKHWELSANWEYASGRPLTLPTASYEGIGEPSPYDPPENDPILDHLGERNKYRTAPMHRLDVSATYTKKKKLWTKSWTFSLYNAYNQQNPFYYSIDTDRQKQERYLAQVSILPILPSVTYAIKF